MATEKPLQPPLSLLPHPASLSHPSPTSIDFPAPGHRDRDAQISKHATQDIRAGESAQQVGNTATRYDILRHHRLSNGQHWNKLLDLTSNTALNLWSPLTGVSFAAESPYFQSANTTRVVQSSSSRNKHLPASRMAELLPRKLQACWKWTAPWNRQSKHATASASGTKMQISCYHQRASSCNFNQSRTEALPVARSRAVGEGREGEPRSSTQSSTGSPGQEHMMSYGAKTNKARNYSICQAKLGAKVHVFWSRERVDLSVDHIRFLCNYPLHELKTTYFLIQGRE